MAFINFANVKFVCLILPKLLKFEFCFYLKFSFVLVRLIVRSEFFVRKDLVCDCIRRIFLLIWYGYVATTTIRDSTKIICSNFVVKIPTLWPTSWLLAPFINLLSTNCFLNNDIINGFWFFDSIIMNWSDPCVIVVFFVLILKFKIFWNVLK